MNSPNISHIPKNRKGALELGLCPCLYCSSEFHSCSNGNRTSCRDTCEYLRIYLDKEEMDLIQIQLRG